MIDPGSGIGVSWSEKSSVAEELVKGVLLAAEAENECAPLPRIPDRVSENEFVPLNGAVTLSLTPASGMLRLALELSPKAEFPEADPVALRVYW